MNNTDRVLAATLSRECTLPPGLRLFVCALAQLANWKTGHGIAGQGRLAAAMGCDARTVRRYKAQLAERTDSPVTVAWWHRSRPDGMNGSDAYSITAIDTGQECRDTGQDGARHRTPSPTNITTGSPQVTPQDQKQNENSFPEKGLGVPSGLTPDWLPNATHVRTAARLGVDLDAAAGSFVAYWQGKAGSERTPLEWARTFGGWLKRQHPPKKAAADDGIEWEVIGSG